MLRIVSRVFLALISSPLILVPVLRAQEAAQTPSESPIPVVTGDFSFHSTFEPGTRMIMPEFDPVVLVPLGRKFLVESEFDMSMNLTRDQGQWGPAVVDHGVEYLQLDYVLNPKLTIVAGRFLTPFGIYRERLHPMWIRDLGCVGRVEGRQIQFMVRERLAVRRRGELLVEVAPAVR